MRPSYPGAARLSLSSALAGLEVIVVDGKAMKRVAKRLKPVRGRKGGVLGGKALGALELRSGVVVAMATHADGETNDAKLVPALLPQVRERVGGRRRWVADRQFCNLTQPAAFAQIGDQCLVRYHPKPPFFKARGRKGVTLVATLPQSGKTQARISGAQTPDAALLQDARCLHEPAYRQADRSGLSRGMATIPSRSVPGSGHAYR